MFTVLSLSHILLVSTATAEPMVSATTDASFEYAFGARVGGYGFRSVEGDRRNAWNDCRMNGMGVFGEKHLTRNAFVEAGADLYFSESFPLEPAEGEDTMDRLSGLLTVAGGMRMFPASRISSYVQIGAGVEMTKVTMTTAAHEMTDDRVLPMGFVGFGGDLRIGARTYLGMNLRAYLMGHFDHAHSEGNDASPLGAEMEPQMSVSPEAAAQAQFYLRYDL